MMRELTFGGAWAAGQEAMRGSGKVITIYGALFLLLPFIVFSIYPQMGFRGLLVILVEPSAYISAETPRTILGIFFISAVLMGAVLYACWSALLARSRDGMLMEMLIGVVQALLSLIVAIIIYILLTIPFTLVGGMVAASIGLDPGAPTGGAVFLAILPSLIAIPLLLFVNARLSLSGPAMAAVGSINPFAGIAQSWRLTAGRWGRVMLFLLPFQIGGYILLGIAVAISTAITIAFPPGGMDWLVTLTWALTGAIYYIAWIFVPLGLYGALRPSGSAETFA
jgi:hypothetical protein